MQRRNFLKLLPAGAATALAIPRLFAEAPTAVGALEYTTTNRKWQAAYDAAMVVLAKNVQVLPHFGGPVLIEGASYMGVWQECGPHESAVYRKVRPDVARNGHMTFFSLQKEDGQLPANNKRTETGFGQIQMAVPIAATAWEVAQATHDDELLRAAYSSCSRWDAWLARYRNLRGTGLTEGFCTYDTGHDNSPRWAGIPNQCPGKDAKRFPPIASLPRLCPDLSATVYGGRRALAAMATALGKPDEAARWEESANTIRKLILEKLYVPDDAAFYDLDATGHFVKIRCDILSRVVGEHVVDQKLFDDLWTRQLHNEHAFWAPYPLPSVAMDDPLFVRPIPRNSWGGATQALTALRAGRWFDHYGRASEFRVMMDHWCDALQRDMTFLQQMDPLTGNFTKVNETNYSPAALTMLDYTWRLAGIHELPEELQWNVCPTHEAATGARFRRLTDTGKRAELTYTAKGATLTLQGKPVAHWLSGSARLITDKQGTPTAFLGLEAETQHVRVDLPGPGHVKLMLQPNQRVTLADALRKS